MDTDGPAPGENLGTELSDAIVGFHEATGRLLGVSAADHKALGVIQREGPLSASELAARTSVTPGAITGLIDRLEAAGLAHRERDPADRRRLVVTASAPTDPRVTAAFAELGRAMAEVVAAFTPEQQQVIAQWASRTSAVLRERTAAITDGLSDSSPR
ncbi:MAG TPA: MarR family transcriptional regulator [Actinomycetaceae bacterium]|nr:MarR family transcriptional regulator [Actinomycetaceae bacterium]